MLSARDIIEYTKVYNPKIADAAKNVRVTKMRAEFVTDEEGDECRQVTAVCRGNTIPREVVMRLYGPRLLTAKIWVSCTCEYWLYHCEVAVNRKGSTDIQFSNGAAPKVTNPGMVPALCKHGLAAIRAGAMTVQPSVRAKKPTKKAKETTKETTKKPNKAPGKDKKPRKGPGPKAEAPKPFSILRRR